MGQAGLLVDYFGNGNLVDAFHPTLQMCYVQGRVKVPEMNLPSNSIGYFDFELPASITNPFLWCDRITRLYADNVYRVVANTYFTRIAGSTTKWRLNVVGQDFLNPTLAHSWINPVIKNDDSIYVNYGGYRG